MFIQMKLNSAGFLRSSPVVQKGSTDSRTETLKKTTSWLDTETTPHHSTGQVADDLDLVKHDVRTKLDELKRQEVERQRMLRRQMNDHLNGLKERESWNPLFDDENPNFFGPEDFKKLLWKVIWSY